jgi:hypothetical protein
VPTAARGGRSRPCAHARPGVPALPVTARRLGRPGARSDPAGRAVPARSAHWGRRCWPMTSARRAARSGSGRPSWSRGCVLSSSSSPARQPPARTLVIEGDGSLLLVRIPSDANSRYPVAAVTGAPVLAVSSLLQNDWRLRSALEVQAPPRRPSAAEVSRPERSPQMGEASCAAPVPDVRASAMGIEEGIQCRGECGEVTVVYAAVLQLAGRLGEERSPVPTRGRDRGRDLDPALDDLDSRAAGRRGPRLLPRVVATGGRAPLRDRPRDRGAITPPHRAQDEAAARRALLSAATESNLSAAWGRPSLLRVEAPRDAGVRVLAGMPGGGRCLQVP